MQEEWAAIPMRRQDHGPSALTRLGKGNGVVRLERQLATLKTSGDSKVRWHTGIMPIYAGLSRNTDWKAFGNRPFRKAAWNAARYTQISITIIYLLPSLMHEAHQYGDD